MSAGARARLLDTSVLIHLLRGKAAGRHIDQVYGLTTAKLRPLIAIVTVGECLAFAKRRQWGANRQAQLQTLINQLPAVDISDGRVLDLYAEIEVATQ